MVEDQVYRFDVTEPSGVRLTLMKANLSIDARGTFCPIPVIKTSEAIRNLEPGAIVEVISDDPAIESDLPAWCKSQNHTVEHVDRDGDDFHYFIRKKQD